MIAINSGNVNDERASSSAPVHLLALHLSLDIWSKGCLLAGAGARTLRFGDHKKNHRQSVQFPSSRKDLSISLACTQA